jgi:hypothetical protein
MPRATAWPARAGLCPTVERPTPASALLPASRAPTTSSRPAVRDRRGPGAGLPVRCLLCAAAPPPGLAALSCIELQGLALAAGCAANYYKAVSGTCTLCKGGATSEGGEATTCSCAGIVGFAAAATYDVDSGCACADGHDKDSASQSCAGDPLRLLLPLVSPRAVHMQAGCYVMHITTNEPGNGHRGCRLRSARSLPHTHAPTLQMALKVAPALNRHSMHFRCPRSMRHRLAAAHRWHLRDLLQRRLLCRWQCRHMRLQHSKRHLLQHDRHLQRGHRLRWVAQGPEDGAVAATVCNSCLSWRSATWPPVTDAGHLLAHVRSLPCWLRQGWHHQGVRHLRGQLLQGWRCLRAMRGRRSLHWWQRGHLRLQRCWLQLRHHQELHCRHRMRWGHLLGLANWRACVAGALDTMHKRSILRLLFNSTDCQPAAASPSCLASACSEGYARDDVSKECTCGWSRLQFARASAPVRLHMPAGCLLHS